MACANFKPPHFFRRMPDNESVLAKGGHGLLRDDHIGLDVAVLKRF
jgi:hypothetical protein